MTKEEKEVTTLYQIHKDMNLYIFKYTKYKIPVINTNVVGEYTNACAMFYCIPIEGYGTTYSEARIAILRNLIVQQGKLFEVKLPSIWEKYQALHMRYNNNYTTTLPNVKLIKGEYIATLIINNTEVKGLGYSNIHDAIANIVLMTINSLMICETI